MKLAFRTFSPLMLVIISPTIKRLSKAVALPATYDKKNKIKNKSYFCLKKSERHFS